jgi:hypothetical protein
LTALQKDMGRSTQLNAYFLSVAHLASLLSSGSVLTTLGLRDTLSLEAIAVV